MPPEPVRLRVGILGAGPRGVSVLERLCANARDMPAEVRVTVHVVDPWLPGPGQVWRTRQSPQLLMNTVSSQITLFTDDSVEMDGVLESGPSLYEWARFLTLMRPVGRHSEDTLAEARELGPDSYPTRAFHGHYLGWAFRRVVSQAPRQVTVKVHRCRAAALDDVDGDPGRQRVRLEDGTELDDLDAVVVAVGHVPVAPTPEEAGLAAFARRHGLTYVPPGNPADADLSDIPPGSAVALRGLGLNFFDHMALLTLDRGGTFRRRRAGSLDYRPSGREPQLYAGSRRGLPYHARGENQKGPYGRHVPMVLTPAKVTELRARSGAGPGLDFRREVWPLIAKEVETVYYSTLLAARGCRCDADRFRAEYLRHPWGTEAERRALEQFALADAKWDWARVAVPHAGRDFGSAEEFRGWLLDHLRQDAAQAREGNVGNPVKAALDVLRDLRNEVRLVVDHGGLTGRSHQQDLDRWYTPMNAFLSIGPPAQRVEEAVALMEAGVLHVTGPGIRVRPDEAVPSFVVESDVPGFRAQATALIEARMPDIDMRRTTDPLLRHLRATGQCRWHTVADPDGPPYQTGGVAVTRRPYRLLDAAGVAHPRRFVLGIPTEAVHWVTAAGIRPAVNSVILADSDAVALTVLSLASRARQELPGLRIGA
ncbi:MAG: FAD/NAD(P)-binding protein [Mycobacteriales bacterium]